MQGARESEIVGGLGRRAWTGGGLAERWSTDAEGWDGTHAGTTKRGETWRRAERKTCILATQVVKKGRG